LAAVFAFFSGFSSFGLSSAVFSFVAAALSN